MSLSGNRRLLAGIAAIAVLAGLCSGTWVWLELRLIINPQSQHSQGVQQWDDADITTYRAFVRVQETFRTSGVYEITVEDGEVTRALLYSEGAFRYDPNPPAFEVDAMQAAAYTMDTLFTRAERLVAELPYFYLHTPYTSHVRYNPEVGYPQQYIQSTCGILINDTIEGCVTEIEVVRFEVLEPGTE